MAQEAEMRISGKTRQGRNRLFSSGRIGGSAFFIVRPFHPYVYGYINSGCTQRETVPAAGGPSCNKGREVSGFFLRPVSVQSSNYWSGTTNANNTGNAWNVNFNNGNANTNNKSNSNYVWPVQGGE